MINAQKTQEETEIPPNYLKDLDRGPITEMSAEDMGWGGSGGDAYRDPSPLCVHLRGLADIYLPNLCFPACRRVIFFLLKSPTPDSSISRCL